MTPALKGWKAIVAVVAFASYQFADDVRAASDLLAGRGWLFAVGLVLLVGVVGFAYSGLAWRMTRYAVTDEAVHYRSGLVFRQQRQARLDRLQAVDVVQPLLARLFGLADLRLEVAGGSGSAVSLAYLREPDAQALRSELLALAAGLRRPTTNPSAADAPAVPVPGASRPLPCRRDLRPASRRPPSARSTPSRCRACSSRRCAAPAWWGSSSCWWPWWPGR